ncbi:hypothetical protein Y032_0587g340 [Ancylostoma ceylanicum]|uniref:Uncharacterized protein n=1 Tax=Ancylostoma ceylanicum TaxID=53326 RepID=A0A016WNY3_9BILA|nr:hypothetical protein Y032_0587g340 [Ancylostoma ceylanicum]
MSQLDRRQSSLRRHASVDEMESVKSKQFADSSSDEESKGKMSSRGSSEKRKKSLNILKCSGGLWVSVLALLPIKCSCTLNLLVTAGFMNYQDAEGAKLFHLLVS